MHTKLLNGEYHIYCLPPNLFIRWLSYKNWFFSDQETPLKIATKRHYSINHSLSYIFLIINTSLIVFRNNNISKYSPVIIRLIYFQNYYYIYIKKFIICKKNYLKTLIFKSLEKNYPFHNKNNSLNDEKRFNKISYNINFRLLIVTYYERFIIELFFFLFLRHYIKTYILIDVAVMVFTILEINIKKTIALLLCLIN